MNRNLTPEKLNLHQKVLQMFIIGIEGTEFNGENLIFQNLLKNGLGGVIFFAQNFKTRYKFKKLVTLINSTSLIPPFLSIDQEGGLVERTITLDEKVDYLTPLALCQSENVDLIRQHTEIMSEDLKELGLNMNFAPLLDVNTNPYNPVIGVRAFCDNAQKVEECSKPVYQTLAKNNIIPVGKHFPGHGEASVDSHLDMPQLNMNMTELESIHINPFKAAIKNNIDALMIAHVHYRAFNKDKIPASLSKEIISDYLVDKLDFKGLIISDDMVMGGIAKHYGLEQSLIKGIEAGIDLFIFRDTTQELNDCIEKIVSKVTSGEISEERINKSVKKILEMKQKYAIFDKFDSKPEFNVEQANKAIDKIALKTVKTIKKGKLIPLEKSKKYLILTPDRSKIFNLSFDKGNLSDYLADFEAYEHNYSINPSDDEIKYILEIVKNYDALIFVSYNAHINSKQADICKNLDIPYVVISTGLLFDKNCFNSADSLISTCCFKPPSLKAAALLLRD